MLTHTGPRLKQHLKPNGRTYRWTRESTCSKHCAPSSACHCHRSGGSPDSVEGRTPCPHQIGESPADGTIAANPRTPETPDDTCH